MKLLASGFCADQVQELVHDGLKLFGSRVRTGVALYVVALGVQITIDGVVVHGWYI
jgi:hypothetical protein